MALAGPSFINPESSDSDPQRTSCFDPLQTQPKALQIMRMESLRRWQLIVGAAFSLTPSAAWPYCPGTDKNFPGYDPHYYSVSKEYARSKYVIIATMDRETWLGEDGKPKPLKGPFQFGEKRPWGFDPYVGAYYDVSVLRSFKGAAPRHLRLFSENSTARFWLWRGVRYVLFISGGRFDPPMRYQLSVDTCGNSGDLPRNQVLLRKVQRLAERG